MIEYGKFSASREVLTDDETGISYEVLVFRNSDGEDWLEVSKNNPSNFYCAVLDNGEIFFATDQADHLQIDRHQIIGLPDLNGYTFGEDGDIYGKIIENGEIVEPPKEMNPLTARQLRLGLVSNGISLSQVEASIDAIENQRDRDAARIEWEYASTFDRQHPLIEQVGGALGLTGEQIDAMWLEALNL